MHLELRLITSLSTIDRLNVEDAVGVLDWRVGGSLDGRGLAESYARRSPRSSWAVSVDRQDYGLFALVPYREIPGTWQTSTYLTPTGRGNGVNERVKRAVFTAARAEGFPLRSSIDQENSRSLAAAEKILDGYTPELVWEEKVCRWAYVYDLSAETANLSVGPRIDADVVGTIRAGMRAALGPLARAA